MSGERKDYAVLISLATREEAEVAAAALRADGIDAFIGNSNHAYTNWGYILALNGLQILVPRSRIEEAKQSLRERIMENACDGEDEIALRRDRWKLWILMAAYVLPGFVLLGMWFLWLLVGGWRSDAWLGPYVYPAGREHIPLDLR